MVKNCIFFFPKYINLYYITFSQFVNQNADIILNSSVKYYKFCNNILLYKRKRKNNMFNDVDFSNVLKYNEVKYYKTLGEI